MKKVLLFVVLISSFLNADYFKGKKIFEKRCASCHGGYISFEKLKENFFEKDNKLLNLEVPTVNMLAYALTRSPKRIGDPEDVEMQQIEIEEFLKDYLKNPDINNTICDDVIVKYYDEKKPIILNDEEALYLSTFFLEYEKRTKIQNKNNTLEKFDINEKEVLEKAKKQNKNIIVYATSKNCYFCKKMDKDVLSLKEIKKQMNSSYLFFKVDAYESKLPFSLQKNFKGMTPTFFFINSNKEILKIYPGAWKKDDFISILKENKL